MELNPTISEQEPKIDPSFRNIVIIVAILSTLVSILAVIAVIQQTNRPPEGSTSISLTPEMSPQPSLDQTASVIAYPITDTMQTFCFDNQNEVSCSESQAGQDASYTHTPTSYQDNGDGTVTDIQTGLMWQKDPTGKMQYQTAIDRAQTFSFAGYDDWRVPTIKELYSLIDFRGIDPPQEGGIQNARAFIDTSVFGFKYGDESAGDRFIDSQWVTTTVYNSEVMGKDRCFFGVNFADGRIKCYPTERGKTYYVRYVRGPSYGINDLVDNQNQTITDRATGLTWMKEDSKKGMNWQEALNYCEGLTLAGSSSWRLPNAKELQSIVDYSRSPDITNSPAIDPLFRVSKITNESGNEDYPYYWSSTTHQSSVGNGRNAVYVAFGRAIGFLTQQAEWVDVHGAGAQRSDPKEGSSSDFPYGRGPQGDAIRIQNYVRCVTQENPS